jgi:hypothetical protein
MFIRVFKAESELEVWLQKGDTFELFAVYPVCHWSRHQRHSTGDSRDHGQRGARSQRRAPMPVLYRRRHLNPTPLDHTVQHSLDRWTIRYRIHRTGQSIRGPQYGLHPNRAPGKAKTDAASR